MIDDASVFLQVKWKRGGNENPSFESAEPFFWLGVPSTWLGRSFQRTGEREDCLKMMWVNVPLWDFSKAHHAPGKSVILRQCQILEPQWKRRSIVLFGPIYESVECRKRTSYRFSRVLCSSVDCLFYLFFSFECWYHLILSIKSSRGNWWQLRKTETRWLANFWWCPWTSEQQVSRTTKKTIVTSVLSLLSDERFLQQTEQIDPLATKNEGDGRSMSMTDFSLRVLCKTRSFEGMKETVEQFAHLIIRVYHPIDDGAYFSGWDHGYIEMHGESVEEELVKRHYTSPPNILASSIKHSLKDIQMIFGGFVC